MRKNRSWRGARLVSRECSASLSRTRSDINSPRGILDFLDLTFPWRLRFESNIYVATSVAGKGSTPKREPRVEERVARKPRGLFQCLSRAYIRLYIGASHTRQLYNNQRNVSRKYRSDVRSRALMFSRAKRDKRVKASASRTNAARLSRRKKKQKREKGSGKIPMTAATCVGRKSANGGEEDVSIWDHRREMNSDKSNEKSRAIDIVLSSVRRDGRSRTGRQQGEGRSAGVLDGEAEWGARDGRVNGEHKADRAC